MNGMITIGVWHEYAGKFYDAIKKAGVPLKLVRYAGTSTEFTFHEDSYRKVDAIWEDVKKQLGL